MIFIPFQFKTYRLLRRTIITKILLANGFMQLADHWIYSISLNENSIFWDFGANKGSFSRLLTNKFKSQCYLFEPNTALHTNYDFESAGVYSFALGGLSMETNFYISKNNEASSLIPDIQDSWSIDRIKKLWLNILNLFLKN